MGPWLTHPLTPVRPLLRALPGELAAPWLPAASLPLCFQWLGGLEVPKVGVWVLSLVWCPPLGTLSQVPRQSWNM